MTDYRAGAEKIQDELKYLVAPERIKKVFKEQWAMSKGHKTQLR